MAFTRKQQSWDSFRKNLKTGLKHGFRSGLEEKNAKLLEALKVPVVFEAVKVKYIVPMTEHTYSPDFELPNGILIETKGKFEPKDRAKHLYLKICQPDLDIRFVFQKPYDPISKGSKTTHAAWADKYGFKWAAALIPRAWIDEPPAIDYTTGAPRPTGPRTVPVPQAALDHFANSARQPHAPGRVKTS